MTRTTTEVGRLKLAHPDLGYDTEDGGTDLHAAVASMWTQVSNHLPCRWTDNITLVDLASTTITHNFGLDLAKLKLLFFEAGAQLTEAQVTAAYSITQVSGNAIAIQNVSGGSKTFNAFIFAFKLGTTNDDLDPIVSGGWDTINGIGWNKSLYVNGNYTVSSDQEFENVIITGNLQLNANLTVRGRLVVLGTITSNGYKFDCDGDVWLFDICSIAGNGLSITIKGNLRVYGQVFKFRSNTATSGHLFIGGDCIIGYPVTPGSASPIGLLSCGGTYSPTNGAGNNVTIRGNAICNIDASGYGQIFSMGCNGGGVLVNGNVIGGINSYGSNGASGYAAGLGGKIEIDGNVVVTVTQFAINSSGGSTTSSTAKNAGAITIRGNCLVFGGNITANGGSASTSGAAGNGGAINIYGDLRVSGNLEAKGGDAATGVAFAAGNGGNITITYGSTIVKGNIYTNSGAGGNAARLGGNLEVLDLSVSQVFTNGGTNNGSSGGYVRIRGQLKSSAVSGRIDTFGGSCNLSGVNAGNGGFIEVYGSILSRIDMNTYGGASTSPAVDAGGGGDIQIYSDALSSDGWWTTSGGNSAGTGSAGPAGNITVEGSLILAEGGRIYANGGANNTNSTGNAGLGGSVDIGGDLNCNSIECLGGNIDNGGSGSAGDSGSFIVKGDLFTGTFYQKGGDALSGTGSGGNSGGCTVSGNLFGADLRFKGGNSFGGDGGICGSVTVKGNLTFTQYLYMLGGDSSKGSGTANGGSCDILTVYGSLIGDNSTDFLYRGGDALSSGLTTGIGGSGRTLINDDPRIRIYGDFLLSDAAASGTCTLRGGDGYTQGGNAPGLMVRGQISVHNAMNIRGGSATNGTGVVGSLGIMHLLNGGYIRQVDASPTGVAESSGTGTFRFNGNLCIGVWNPDLTKYPLARYVAKCSSGSVYSGCAMVAVNQRAASAALFDAGNGNNYFPNGAAGTGGAPGGPMFGYDLSGTTTWKWRSFANA